MTFLRPELRSFATDLFLLARRRREPIKQRPHFGGDRILARLNRVNTVVILDGQPVVETIRTRNGSFEPQRQLEEVTFLEELVKAAGLLRRKRFRFQRRLQPHSGEAAGTFEEDAHGGMTVRPDYKAAMRGWECWNFAPLRGPG